MHCSVAVTPVQLPLLADAHLHQGSSTLLTCTSSRPFSRESVHCLPSRASLYERPVNLETAKAAHAEFRRVMREAGVKVLTVRDVMAYGVGDHSAHAARWLPARRCRAAAGRRVLGLAVQASSRLRACS